MRLRSAILTIFIAAISGGIFTQQAAGRETKHVSKIFVNAVVKDYASWQAAFGQSEAYRNKAGITNPRMFQKAGAPNEVIVVFDIADAGKARAFMNSEETKAAMAKTGVTSIVSVDFTE